MKSKLHNSSVQPVVNVFTTIPSNNSNWLVNSIASHHITGDLANFFICDIYKGGDDVLIDNGFGLVITHTGLAYVSHNIKDFLSNILCVPSIKKKYDFSFLILQI